MAQIAQAEARPPYVSFEVRAVEDRAASIEAGHYVAKNVDFALITPMGSKDRIERIAEEWLGQISIDMQSGRIPREWVTAFKEGYKAWKEGLDLPETGTPIEAWPIANPAQIKNLRAMHVRTVEDLAAANEETLSRIGMGGRGLKQRAQDWLTSATGAGKLTEQLNAFRVENESLRARNTALEERLVTLAAKVDALAEAPAPAKKL